MDTTRITLKHYMDTTWINIKNKWKKSAANGHILYVSIYLKRPEQANL